MPFQIAAGAVIAHALDGQVLFELDDPHGNAPLAGVLALEATGGPTTVAFKNIRLRKIRAGLSTDGAGRSGWLDLFKPDQGLKGWFGSKGEYAQVWTVSADGTVTGSGAKSHLYSEGQYTNFEFKADVNLSPRANSGMYFRARPAPDYPHGYEAQLYNTGSGDDRKTGSLYKFSDVKRLLVSDNTWFNQHVIAVGNRIVIKVNGRVVVDYVDDQRTYTSGRLALQQISPTASVRFRNVLVKPLPEDATAAWAEVRRETPELRP